MTSDSDDSGDGDELFAVLRQQPDGEDVEERLRVIEAALLGSHPAPRRFGRFIELQAIGRGGMGEVYEAYDPVLDRKVAVKLVRSDMTRHDRRLEREAMALARLQHPNVVQIYEVGHVGDRLFLAMERVEGQTLHAWQRERHGWRECVDAYLDAGRGLAAAHDAGLVHRDFKPANCIRDASGRVRVLDFGLARVSQALRPTDHVRSGIVGDDEPSLASDDPSNRHEQPTETGSPVGTKAYMAPECLAAQASARSDQYAFCVALHEALHGRRPADPSRRPAPPSLPVAPVPRWLQRAIQRGLHEDPEQRWPSMHALLHELERGRRHRRVWLGRVSLVAAAVTGLGVGLLWLTVTEQRCDPPDELLVGTWGEHERERVRGAILETELPHAEDTWARVEPALDRYAEAWVQASVEACEASVLHRQPTEELEHRHDCLGKRRSALQRTVKLLASADTELAGHAVDLVAGLPSLERCAGATASERASRSAEPDPEIATLREELERARLLEAASKYAEGLELVALVLARAEALADGPLRAEALQVQGQLQLSVGEHGLAKETLASAVAEAMKVGLLEVELEALSGLVYVLGVADTQTDASLFAGKLAKELLDPTVDPVLVSEVLVSIAQVHTIRGERVERELARRGYEDALAVLGEREHEGQLAQVRPLEGLAQLERREGRPERAVALFQRTVEIREQQLGPHHPATAHSLVGLCGVMSQAPELTDPELPCQRALEILAAQPSLDHGWIGHAHHTLGVASSTRGNLQRAEAELRLAIPSLELAGDRTSEHPALAEARFNLARVLEQRGRLSEAIDELDEALELASFDEPTAANRQLEAATLRSLGKLLLEQGQAERAEQALCRALRIYEAEPEPDRLLVAQTLRRLAETLVAQQRPAHAMGLLERALSLYAATPEASPTAVAAAQELLSELTARVGERGEAPLGPEPCE